MQETESGANENITLIWRGDGKERVKLCRCLLSPAVRTCCSLPFNIWGTKYLRLWEQDEKSCPCPALSEVKQGLLPSAYTPLLLPCCLMTAKINNAKKINFSARWDCPGNSWSLLWAVILWWRPWLWEALPQWCFQEILTDQATIVTEILVLRLSTCLVLQVQSASAGAAGCRCSLLVKWTTWVDCGIFFGYNSFFHAVGHVKLALGACQQACLWGTVFWPHISAARLLLCIWSPGRALHWAHHTDKPS